MPQLYQENPDLANRLTSDWKEGSYNQENSRQIVAFLTIIGQTLFGISCFTGYGAVPHLMRSVASLMGYFNLGEAPAVCLLRSNFMSLVSLILCMGGLLIGAEVMSASLLMLMIVNLFDVFSAATVDPVNNAPAVPEADLSPQDAFWLTSWRTNAYNESRGGSVIFFMFM